jgi:tetratricopeptide (TPR) repeat protein
MDRDVPQAQGWMVDLLAGSPGTRDALLDALQQRQMAGDAAGAGVVATLMLLHTLADFADFRGLPQAMAAFDVAPPDGVHADAVRLGRPSLDHRHAFDDPALAPARERVLAALSPGSGLPPDERMLLAKVLVDFDGMRDADPALPERVLARMQDMLVRASPRWQSVWWRLRVQTLDFAGQTVAAQQAAEELQRLAALQDDPALHFALAGEQMRTALHVDDRPGAERAFRALERLRPCVPPALLPHGLRQQVALLLRRGDFHAALQRTQLILDLCEDHAVPERDRAGYVEQRAHALTGLGRHAEAVALLESLRPTQAGGQAGMLEAIIAMARAVQALAEGAADAPAQALAAVRCAAAVGFHRFLMSFPHWAGRIAAIGLDAGVETEFLTRAVRERRLPPPQPWREQWPWPLHVRVLGGLEVRRDSVAVGGAAGKAQRKPLELLALLAAHPRGLDVGTLIDALWPSLEADAPRASLEMAVSRLRKWLDRPDAVRVADGRVQLDPQRVWTDVSAFDAAVAAGDAPAALALYRGPLLQGDRLGGLALQARERLAAQLSAVVLQQAAAWQAEGRRPEAMALLGRGLAAEPGQAALQAAIQGAARA